MRTWVLPTIIAVVTSLVLAGCGGDSVAFVNPDENVEDGEWIATADFWLTNGTERFKMLAHDDASGEDTFIAFNPSLAVLSADVTDTGEFDVQWLEAVDGCGADIFGDSGTYTRTNSQIVATTPDVNGEHTTLTCNFLSATRMRVQVKSIEVSDSETETWRGTFIAEKGTDW